MQPTSGKMLLTAVVLQCLDPVLNIVCCLREQGPFLLPSDPCALKGAASRIHELSAGTLSDQMAMFQAFNLWMENRYNGNNLK